MYKRRIVTILVLWIFGGGLYWLSDSVSTRPHVFLDLLIPLTIIVAYEWINGRSRPRKGRHSPLPDSEKV